MRAAARSQGGLLSGAGYPHASGWSKGYTGRGKDREGVHAAGWRIGAVQSIFESAFRMHLRSAPGFDDGEVGARATAIRKVHAQLGTTGWERPHVGGKGLKLPTQFS
ncbi:unnamed protein product [Cutaneotrichosporon oleaginosum]